MVSDFSILGLLHMSFLPVLDLLPHVGFNLAEESAFIGDCLELTWWDTHRVHFVHFFKGNTLVFPSQYT